MYFRLGHLGQIGLDQERGLRLPEEDVGGGVHGLAGGGPQRDLEQPADLPHHPGHRAQVEQDRHHEVEEVDDGEDLEEEVCNDVCCRKPINYVSFISKLYTLS